MRIWRSMSARSWTTTKSTCVSITRSSQAEHWFKRVHEKANAPVLGGQSVYYHGTPLGCVPKILKNGLLPSSVGTLKAFVEKLDTCFFLKVPGVHEFTLPGIYTTTFVETAPAYATPTRPLPQQRLEVFFAVQLHFAKHYVRGSAQSRRRGMNYHRSVNRCWCSK